MKLCRDIAAEERQAYENRKKEYEEQKALKPPEPAVADVKLKVHPSLGLNVMTSSLARKACSWMTKVWFMIRWTGTKAYRQRVVCHVQTRLEVSGRNQCVPRCLTLSAPCGWRLQSYGL